MEKINSQFLYSFSYSNDWKKLVEWCMSAGLIADTYLCPICKKLMKLVGWKQSADRYKWRCQSYADGGHDIQRTLRKGSWFASSHLRIDQILLVTLQWCMQLSNDFIMVELDLASGTVCDWKACCRVLCAKWVTSNFKRIGGDGTVVEIVAKQYGGKKYCKAKNVDTKWVIVGNERGTDECFMTVLNEVNKDVLLEIVTKNIAPGATVVSECWCDYECLNDAGFRHLTANCSMTFENAKNFSDTNSVKATWSAVKRMLPRRVKNDDLQNYLFEYLWRRKNKNKATLMQNFLNAIKEVYPPSSQDNESEFLFRMQLFDESCLILKAEPLPDTLMDEVFACLARDFYFN